MFANVYRVNFPFEQFQVRRMAYRDGLLDRLRHDHNSTHSFFRGGDFIYASPMMADTLEIGTVETVSLEGSLPVASSLVKHIFFRTFKDRFPGRTPISFYPFRVISTRDQHDLALNFLPRHLKRKVRFQRLIELHLREISMDRRRGLGFVPAIRHRWHIEPSVREVLREGYSLIGKPVIRSTPVNGLEGVLAPDEALVGTVTAIDYNTAMVETNNGAQAIPIDTLHLSRRWEDISDYLAFHTGPDGARDIMDQVRLAQSGHSRPEVALSEMTELMRILADIEYRNLDSFTFSISPQPTTLDKPYALNETKLIFDLGPGAASNSPLSGLLNHGPYDSARFDKKEPHILVLCHHSHRGSMSSLLAKLRDGIPESRYFKKGFQSLFQLHSVDFTIQETDGMFPENYEDAVKGAVDRNAKKPFDMAIIVGREAWKSYPPNDSPYFRAKSALMALGIPVQSLREDRLRYDSQHLSDILGPLALQMYAKLGGIPWVLPAAQNVDRELVIGIGTSLIRPNLFSDVEQSRVVGLTTFFSGDGRYLMGRRMRVVPYEEYFTALLQSLRESLLGVAKEYGWAEGEVIRIVIHAYKPLRDIEATVIEKLADEFSTYKLRFAFIKLSSDHPFYLFRQGVDATRGASFLAADRGDNVSLEPRTSLLQLRRVSRIRGQRFSAPLLVSLHDRSSFGDMYYLCQQVFDFSRMSWRTFFPTDKPVTVLYSELMAELCGKLQLVDGWNEQVLDMHFRKKQWFL